MNLKQNMARNIQAGTAIALILALGSSAPSQAGKPAPEPTSKYNTSCANLKTYPGTNFTYCAPAELIPRSINVDGSLAKSPAYGAYDEVTGNAPTHHTGMNPEMDWTNAAAPMCFPIRSKAYANSQVYNPGGDHYPSTAKPSGVQGNPDNYSYPWRDNFCEARGASRANKSCRVGHGHQGQDIRPEKPIPVTYIAIAPEDADVISVPGADGKGFTVTLLGKSPPYRKYRYLHMESVMVSPAHPDIKAGAELGKVSNYFGWHLAPDYARDGNGKYVLDGNGKKIALYKKAADGSDAVDAKGKKIPVMAKVFDHTLIHLHFEIMLAQQETVGGTTYAAKTFVSPYMALVNAYGRRMSLEPGRPDTICHTQ